MLYGLKMETLARSPFSGHSIILCAAGGEIHVSLSYAESIVGLGDSIRIRFDLRRFLSRKWSGNMSDVFGIRFGKNEKSVIFDLK